jgi:hypothetical protein
LETDDTVWGRSLDRCRRLHVTLREAGVTVCNADLDIFRHGTAELVLEVLDQVIRVLADMGAPPMRDGGFKADMGDEQKP